MEEQGEQDDGMVERGCTGEMISLERRPQMKEDMGSVEDSGMANTLLKPTGQRIMPLACTRRLVSEMRTT